MEFISVKEAAKRWGISERRVRDFCSEGKIEGAQHQGRMWLIPLEADRPEDGRISRQECSEPDTCRFKCGHIVMTRAMAMQDILEGEEKELQELGQAYLSYEANRVIELAKALEKKTTSRIIKAGCYYYWAFSGILTGSYREWQQAMELFAALPAPSLGEQKHKELLMYSVLGASYFFDNIPEWLAKGDFSGLSKDALAHAINIYMYHRFINFQHRSPKFEAPVYNILAQVVEQSRSYVAEIYNNIYLGIGYRNVLDNEQMQQCYDRAVLLAKEHNCYTPIICFYNLGGTYMDKTIFRLWPAKYDWLVARARELKVNFYRLQNYMTTEMPLQCLSVRELEVAEYAANGASNKEIASFLGLSVYTVKEIMSEILQKTGAERRKDLVKFFDSYELEKKKL